MKVTVKASREAKDRKHQKIHADWTGHDDYGLADPLQAVEVNEGLTENLYNDIRFYLYEPTIELYHILHGDEPNYVPEECFSGPDDAEEYYDTVSKISGIIQSELVPLMNKLNDIIS